MHGVQFRIAEKNHMNFLFILLKTLPVIVYMGHLVLNTECHWEIYVLAKTIQRQKTPCIVELCLTINVQNMAEADRKCQMSWLS